MTGGERFLSAEKIAPWIQPPKRDQKVENNPQAIQTKTTGSGDHQCVPHPPIPGQIQQRLRTPLLLELKQNH